MKMSLPEKYYNRVRYLDPRTGRWLSTDPALGEYIPLAPVNDEAKKHNRNLPGLGGIFNTVNFHLYHYAGNNPVKYTDPDGRVLLGINATYNMSNYTKFLGNSTTETINSHGCYITAFANVFASSKYYGLPLINAEKYDSPLKINSDKALFGKDLGELKGKDAMNALFGTGKWDYWTRDKQGTDGLLEKLKEYKESNKAYMILGIFDLSEDTPVAKNHMVGISELPDSEGYFNSGITGSSNGDYLRLINIREKSAYNIKNLKEIRVIFLED